MISLVNGWNEFLEQEPKVVPCGILIMQMSGVTVSVDFEKRLCSGFLQKQEGGADDDLSLWKGSSQRGKGASETRLLHKKVIRCHAAKF